MSTYSVAPLVAVGWEGFFGALSILLLTPLPFIFPSIADRSPFFDLPRGWHQTISNPRVLGSSVAIAFSIGFFNFFGLSVTRHVSATARSITDTCRTITIWIISLGLGWEVLVWPYSTLQVTGFGLLVYVLLLPLPFPWRHDSFCSDSDALYPFRCTADTALSSSITSSLHLLVSAPRSLSQRGSTNPCAPRRTRRRRWTRLLPFPLIWALVGTMLYQRRRTRRTARGKLGVINLEKITAIHRYYTSVAVLEASRIGPSTHFHLDHNDTLRHISDWITLYHYLFRRHAKLFICITSTDLRNGEAVHRLLFGDTVSRIA